METAQKITPFLWFNGNVEEAVNYYTSIFKNSRILNVSRIPDGKTMMATLIIEGQQFMLLDGGPQFPFTEAVSFMVNCETQEEVDDLWGKLTANGGQESMCGWLKDKFGLSWQITPKILLKLMADPDREKSNRVMQAMMQMRKIDIKKLQEAYDNQ
ncbi:MAG TPA: VOC family protein [Mucilaginibacter sp.]|nr:VOC family protein [Mucilaginibacter sp.]